LGANVQTAGAVANSANVQIAYTSALHALMQGAVCHVVANIAARHVADAAAVGADMQGTRPITGSGCAVVCSAYTVAKCVVANVECAATVAKCVIANVKCAATVAKWVIAYV